MADVAGISPVAGSGREQAGPGGAPPHQPPAPHPDAEPIKTAPPPAVTMAPSIAGLSAGQVLEGDIVGTDGDGHPILETPRGRFALDPTAGLEAGMQARLVVTKVGRHLAAQVVARNDLPTEPPIDVVLSLVQPRGLAPTAVAATAPRPQPQNAPPQPGHAAIQSTPASVFAPMTAPLLFHRAQPAPPQPASQPLDTAAKTLAPAVKATSPPNPLSAQAVLAGVAAAMPVSAPEEPTALAMGAVLQATVLAGPAAAPPNDSPPPGLSYLPGAPIRVAVIAITAPGALSPIAAPPKNTPLARLADSGRVLTFVVQPDDGAPRSPSPPDASVSALQRPVLRLHHDALDIALPAAQPLPPGAKLTLAMLDPPPHPSAAPLDQPKSPSAAVPATASQPAPTPAPSIAAPVILPETPLPRLQPQAWPALAQVAAAIAPVQATNTLSHLPTPGPKLANEALFFWRALGLGSAEAWLEPQARTLAQTGDLARLWAMLQRDFALMSEQRRAPASGQSGEWRPFALPLQSGDGVQLVTWFSRPIPIDDQTPNGGGKQPDQGSAPERDFVLDVEFERFGRLRFKGQARPGKLDLAIASAQPLPSDLQNSTRALFQDALGAAGLAGELSFQLGLHRADLP